MITLPQTVIFWGAGATAPLGMRGTDRQSRFLHDLISSPKDTPKKPLIGRIHNALGTKVDESWVVALNDLLIILGEWEDGEGEDNHLRVATVTDGQMAAMQRNWKAGADDDALRNRIITLRTLYDWPALKEIVRVCPARKDDVVRLVDLFNVLEMHGNSGHGLRGRQGEFLTLQRVTGALNALRMLLQAVFYIDWQQLCIGDKMRRKELEHHYTFARSLGQRIQRQGQSFSNDTAYDSKEFYNADVSFVSMNYDPIALWCQFVANRDLNRDPAVPHVGTPSYKLQIYHDLGHFVATRRVVRRTGSGTLWHPMNQSSAQRLNDPDHGANERARISKFLFPHGCLWWRECPNCGKLSSYMGHTWDRASRMLIPPPPLRKFVANVRFEPGTSEEKREWERGAVDARACVHCDTLTYAHHTPAVMQSNFKSTPPPFIQEIQRDLNVTVQEASHIIFMGYSLPDDDVDYRAFFATRRRRERKDPVRCSVVVGTDFAERWHGAAEWEALLAGMKQGEPPRTTLESAGDLFGRENVRFYGGGIPSVLLDGGDKVTDSAVERLLNWDSS